PELKAIHPLGKSPVITDNGRTIAETGAIITYIIDTYASGKLIPAKGTDEYLRYTYWMHYAEGSAMTPLLLKLIFTAIPRNAPGLMRGFVNGIMKTAQARISDPQIQTHVDYWQAELSKSEWFVGADFTAADIMMSFPLEAGAMRGDARSRPKVAAFLDRIHARPAYKRALEKGGPYDFAN
ncbi:MAG: glutathione S-transferase N-terminal domain-containing protein, partial [Hyphomonadaceae bacterium]